MIRKLGRFVEFSVFAHDVTVDWSIISDRKQLDVLGVHLGPYQYPFVIDAIARDRIPTEGVVTHKLPLEKFEEGFDMEPLHQTETNLHCNGHQQRRSLDRMRGFWPVRQDHIPAVDG